MGFKTTFEERGFFVYRNLILPSMIAHFLAELEAVFERQLGLNGLPTHGHLKQKFLTLFNFDHRIYLKTIGSLSRLYAMQELLHHENILKAIREELGYRTLYKPDGPVFNSMAEDLRIPGGYFGFEAHQDYATTQGSERAVAVWAPLYDVGEEDFPMEIMPGSHRHGLFPLKDLGYVFATEPAFVKEHAFEKVLCNAGDVVFMDIFAIHRTCRSGAPGSLRIACSTRFEDGADERFVQNGYPCGIERKINRERYHRTPGS